eukprot:127039-Pelagomonas_calceolata.AAC.2
MYIAAVKQTHAQKRLSSMVEGPSHIMQPRIRKKMSHGAQRLVLRGRCSKWPVLTRAPPGVH